MIIRRVRVRRFRKLVDQSLECGPGLNVVRGRNDAGKSTLHLAFSAALFPIRPSEARSFGPWGSEDGPGEITLEFEADGSRYTLHKDFTSRRVSLTGGGRSWDTPKEVERRIGEFLGFQTLALFRATAHIGQWELAQVQKEKEIIGTRLSAIMTGGDEDAARVLKLLEERIRKMELGLRRPSNTPGPLKRDEDRMRHLAAEQQRLALDVAAIEQAAADRARIAAQIVALNQQVREDAVLLQANRDLLDLDRGVEVQRRRVLELRSLSDRLDAATRELDSASRDPSLNLNPVAPDVLQTLQTAALRAELLNRDARGAEQPESSAAADPRKDAARSSGGRTAGPAWVPIGIAAAVVAGAGGIVLLLDRHVGAGLGAVALAIALGAAAVAARSRALAASMAIERTAQVEAARRADEAAARLAFLRKAAQEADEAVRRQLDVLGVTSVPEALERQELAVAARRRCEMARAVLEPLLGERTREGITEEYRRALVELAAMETKRDAPDLALRRLEPAAFQRLVTEAERRRTELEDHRVELHTLDGRLAGRSPHEELARVEEELADVRARHARTARLVRVLNLTREVLGEARSHTIVPGRALLEERASEYVRRLSAGAYERISVDEQTLAPRVWVGPPKKWADVSAREIGSGGVDQCYLALRLGLVDLLCEGRRPPLFLDDPFLAYDEDRQAAALRFLRDLAQRSQIFLFTCRGVYDAHADHLVILDEAAAVSGPQDF
ncbi:MAG TPA: AAA family ATPase [bacterium]|nr:AAA family ATPase [bacterium]